MSAISASAPRLARAVRIVDAGGLERQPDEFAAALDRRPVPEIVRHRLFSRRAGAGSPARGCGREQIGERRVHQPLARDAVQAGERRRSRRRRVKCDSPVPSSPIWPAWCALSLMTCELRRGERRGQAGGDRCRRAGRWRGRSSRLYRPLFASSGTRGARDENREGPAEPRFHGRVEARRAAVRRAGLRPSRASSARRRWRAGASGERPAAVPLDVPRPRPRVQCALQFLHRHERRRDPRRAAPATPAGSARRARSRAGGARPAAAMGRFRRSARRDRRALSPATQAATGRADGKPLSAQDRAA